MPDGLSDEERADFDEGFAIARDLRASFEYSQTTLLAAWLRRAAGAGGGSGAYARKIINAPLSSSYSVTIGAAGTAGVGSTPTSGGTGGTTVFGPMSCVGGIGGVLNNGNFNPTNTTGSLTVTAVEIFGGAGAAIPSGGDVNVGGNPGGNGWFWVYSISGTFTISIGESGDGGASQLGGGGFGSTISGAVGFTTPGGNGIGYGSGGAGGAVVKSTGNANGGAGAAGVVIVREYIS